MDYKTYISAARKLKSLGQKKKADDFIEHANKLQKKDIEQLSFDILVGEVKVFKDAKFQSAQFIKEKEGNTIMIIFNSGVNNTHRINATVENGVVKYYGGNLFNDRKSVNNYQILLKKLANFQKDIQEGIKVKPEDVKVINRSFYI